MSTSVTLPALGESVTEGTVTRWLKQVGDTVAADEPLLEVSTDKVDTEIPSPAAGVLLEIKAAEDETVEVGAVLAVIGEAGEQPGGDSGGDQQSPAAEAPAEQPAEQPAQQQPAQQQPAQPQAEQPSQPQAEQTDTSAQQPQAEQAQQPQAEDDQPEQPTGGAQPAPAGEGTEVTLPALGESVTEGTVSRWLKQVGDSVAADEALLEVSTDKVDTEIPSPTAGTLLEIRVKEDETVEVGAVLGVIGSADAAPAAESAPAAPAAEPKSEPKPEPKPEPAAAPEPAAEAPAPAPQPEPAVASAPAPAAQAPAAQAPVASPPAAPAPTSETTGDGPGYVTPLVRKLAAEHQVDLGSITGTGVGGRIRKQDVLAAAEAAKSAAAQPAAEAPAAAAPAAQAPAAAPVQPSSLRGTTEKMSRLRKIIAKRMVESLQTSAQLTTVVEVDLTVISRLRAKVKNDFLAREGVKLSYLPFLIKATVDALKIHPKLNATLDTEAETVTYPATENVSIAVDTDKGLVVPVIKSAGDLSITGLAKKIADLADRTRSNKLSPDDIAGGTFTVTNTGSRGALIDTPIVNQPQVAILGTGALVKRPVVLTDKVLGETIAVRDMMYLSLSYDHRIVDGADAARFLVTLKERLEEGDFGSEFGL
ncbi:2-oxoglutarate dehydrogenase, E2 component, dihydrolipoamide succinyltransferase [Microlunatus parietis]|uniref:Dihydrolipoamide acetyltransferase component of pyruvate dehydrogenase complex n=1 Tax=Microlunatus parietis TaxID=682979 RepID=A0A7Y9I6X8_9ACTN|nr:2-oxoglutarate dehydrogenase, E2 component, dihydrolipoamide succinyltransferase [Microlunatus parietis]NYE70894.1 2-oxoglutarate dehydrogenase E2 component (dihydrolipoamide succinyltransferase) [Microlunatus parietis]